MKNFTESTFKPITSKRGKLFIFKIVTNATANCRFMCDSITSILEFDIFFSTKQKILQICYIWLYGAGWCDAMYDYFGKMHTHPTTNQRFANTTIAKNKMKSLLNGRYHTEVMFSLQMQKMRLPGPTFHFYQKINK